MNNTCLAIASVIILSAIMLGSTSQAAKLIRNGGFEGGTYTSTIGGFSNSAAPVDWVPNEAFDANPTGDNGVIAYPHSGSYALTIGNLDAQPLASLSQTFNDVPGKTYNASLYVLSNGAWEDSCCAQLSVQIDGTPLFISSQFFGNIFLPNYTLETFSFTGSGRDMLTIDANTDPGNWFVDDVQVLGPAADGVPEPVTWAMMILGFGLLGAGLRTRRGKHRLAEV